ncbi:MAG: hypothetical protein U0003_05150 [Vampirovibrionales bacterium]
MMTSIAANRPVIFSATPFSSVGVQRKTALDAVYFGSQKKDSAQGSPDQSKLWAGVKLAGIAALGLFFAGPIGAALGGITMMDLAWGFVIPELIAYGAQSHHFTRFRATVADSIYKPMHRFLMDVGNGWLGQNLMGIPKKGGKQWAAAKLDWLDPAKLHERLKRRVEAQAKNSSLIGSLGGLRNHFRSLKDQHGLQWAEAMTHTLYSGMVIARNRMTIKGFWTSVSKQFEQGLLKGFASLFTLRFWKGFASFKNGFNLFKLAKSLIIGNLVLRLATEALHAAATLFMGKDRWQTIRNEHDHKIDPLDETLSQAEAAAAKTAATDANKTDETNEK